MDHRTLRLKGADLWDVQLTLEAIGRQGCEAESTQAACEVKPAAAVGLPEEGAISVYLPLINR